MNRRMIVPAILSYFGSCLGLCLGLAAPTLAETLKTDTAVAQVSQIGPTRGMSMDQVERQYGAPRNALAPVGDPPITRWEYPNFVVFFEYKYVIHSVAAQGS